MAQNDCNAYLVGIKLVIKLPMISFVNSGKSLLDIALLFSAGHSETTLSTRFPVIPEEQLELLVLPSSSVKACFNGTLL